MVDRLRSWAYDQQGQTTSEYVLCIVVAAIVVGVFSAFVQGGGLNGVFKDVVGNLIDRVQL